MGYPSITINWISTIIALVALGIASYTDLKTREVPDWLSYGLVITGVAMNGIFSVALGNASFILHSLLGFGIFFGLAMLMFYTGQWGGGDSKILMGLGAVIGWPLPFQQPSLLFAFLVNILVVGGAYGLLWSISLAIKNWRRVKKELKKLRKEKGFVKAFPVAAALAIVLLAMAFIVQDGLFRIFWVIPAGMVLLMFYAWIFLKAVEKASMIKWVTPDKLTEGDWIAEEVKVSGKYICGPKDLGIEKKQIALLKELYRKKKIGKILVKEGIPFVPSFFIAFIVSMVWGNLILMILQNI